MPDYGLTIDLATYWSGKGTPQVDDLVDLEAGVEAGTISHPTGAGAIFVGGSIPVAKATGDLWMKTSASPGPTVQPMRWDGSAWLGVGVIYSATAPSTTDTGTLWYDTTLNILRVYNTLDSLAGWHPVDAGLMLMTNRSGATVGAARAVIASPTHTPDTDRQYTTTTVLKDQSVIGITLEEADDNANAVVAMVGSGHIVDLVVNMPASAAIAKNDYIGTDAVAGEGIGLGPRATNAYSAAGTRTVGVPVGAFCVAMEAESSDTTTSVHLCCDVGTGQWVYIAESLLDSVTQASVGTSAWTESDLTSDLVDADHTPCAALVHVEITGDAGAAGDNFQAVGTLSADQSATHLTVGHTGKGGASGLIAGTGSEVVMPTVDDTTSAAGLGPKFATKTQLVTGSSATTALSLRGYLH